MEYFSNAPGPCPSERLPKPKDLQKTDQKKRKIGDDDKGCVIFFISIEFLFDLF